MKNVVRFFIEGAEKCVKKYNMNSFNMFHLLHVNKEVYLSNGIYVTVTKVTHSYDITSNGKLSTMLDITIKPSYCCSRAIEYYFE